MAVLGVVSIQYEGHHARLERLATRIGDVFGQPTKLLPAWFDVSECYDERRGQYNSSEVLRRLRDSPAEAGDRLLGVTGFDLFIPVLTFVFGEAQLDGRAAVVSSYRLDCTLYGLPPDEQLLRSRLEKESIHELGHAFGLIHCRELDCVMRPSTDAGQIDLKGAAFCRACARELDRTL